MSDSGYEKKDVNLNKIILTGVISVVAVIVVLVLVLNYFTTLTEEIRYEQVLKPESVQLRELRARENEELTSYKCLDSTNQIYQIPINRAMDLIADEAYRQGK